MAVTCLVVGLNEWERFTEPMIESCRNHAPDLRLLIVDNGSQPSYPIVDGAMVVRSDEPLSYAGGINYGMQHTNDDWVMVVNNDVLIHKPITERIENLDQNCLHGFHLAHKGQESPFAWDYLSGWCLIACRGLWQAVGDFDENCKPMYFEDADYSIRAVKAGFGLILHDREEWGVEHLGNERHKERRQTMNKMMTQRKLIMRYVREKHG